MRTDQFFYELFKLDPRSLFQLVHLQIEGEYIFESITVKTTEKRFDGFCKRIDGPGPNIFLEIQGYPDSKIYWRLFRELCTYYEQTDSQVSFVVIVLFLDEKYDPGNCPLTCVLPGQLIRANLLDCLNAVGEHAGILTVLKPMALSQKEELFDILPQWRKDLHSLLLSAEKMKTLIELLEYIILQRFPKMNRKEVESMLQLTPLEETVAFQETLQLKEKELSKKWRKEGLKEGLKEGITKGELMGEIRLAQRILKRPISPKTALVKKSIKELKEMFRQLEAELQGFPQS